MKNTLKIDFANGRIVMDRTFAKKCANTASEEYTQLQRVRLDYPTFKVYTRHIKKNTKKESYKGLTYAYMEDYIRRHEKGEKLCEVMAEYDELRLIAECHSTGHRYPAIKKWFLAKYPEVSGFGAAKEDGEAQEETQDTLELMEPPQEQESEGTEDLSKVS